MPIGQPVERALYRLLLFQLDHAVQRAVAIGRKTFGVSVDVFEESSLEVLAAQAIDAAVRSDREQPTSKGLLGVVAVELQLRAFEDLVDGVFSVERADQTRAEPRDVGPKRFEEAARRLARALACSLEALLDRRFVHLRSVGSRRFSPRGF